MRINLFIFLASCLLCLSAFAQTEEYWFAFKVTSVDQQGAEQFLVTIDHGSEIGLSTNQSGELWATVNPKRDGTGRFVANLTLQEVVQGKSIARVQSKESIYEGDVVFVKIPVKKEKHSIYFFVEEYGIELLNEAGKPYYTIDEILKSDGTRLRTEKFISMQQSINEAGRKLKESGNQLKVKEGKSKGKFLHEVLIETDTVKIWSYLYHLVQDYTQTMGKSMSLVQDYSDYSLEGDRITGVELKELFLPEDSTKWDDHFNYYQRKINTALVEDWYKEAKGFRENKQYQEAEDLLLSCVFLSEKMNEHFNSARYEYEMSLVFEARENYQVMTYWLERADESFQKAGSPFGRGYALHFLAQAYGNLLKNKEAIETYREAIKIREELIKSEPDNAEHRDNLFTSVEAIALLFNTIGDFEASLEYNQYAVKLANENNKPEKQAVILWNVGIVYANDAVKNYSAAIQYFDQAFEIYKSLQDTTSMVTLRKNSAINYDKLNNYEKAKQAVDDAISLARRWDKPATLAFALDYQGVLFEDHKDYVQSIISYSESEKIYIHLNDTAKLIQAKKNLTDVYKSSKQYSLAVRKAQERIALVHPTDLSKKADAYWDFALLQGKDYLNNPKKAVEFFREVEKCYVGLKDTANWIIIINNIAINYRDAGDSVNAYKTHERALAITTRPHLKADRAYTYEKLGFSYGHFKNYGKQLAAFNESFRLYQELQQLIKAGNAAENIATAYKDKMDYDNVNNYYLKSISLYEKAGDKSEMASSYWDVAYNQGENQRNYDDAISNYQIAYDLFKEVKDSVNASVMLSNIGQNYWSLLDFQKAIASHRAAIELATKCKNYKQLASSWSKLATLYTESNNPVESSNALVYALEALKITKDSTLLSSTYHDLAANALKAKDYTKSFDFSNQAIAIRKALKDTVNWASSIYQQAGGYQSKLEYKQAMDSYNQALVLQRRIKDKSGVVYTLANMGMLLQGVDNNYKQAEIYFKEAVTLALGLNDDNILAYCYLRMKGLYRSQGKSKLADEFAVKALDLYKKNKQWKEVASTLIEIGADASYVYGDNSKAIQYIDRAQVISDTLNDLSIKAMVLGSRSSVMRETGEFQKALILAEQSLTLYKELHNEWGMAGAYIDLGNIYKQLGEYVLALDHQQKADSLYKKVKSDYSRLAPLANIGEIYTSQGDYKKGLEFYEQSLALMKKANDLNENLSIIQAAIGESYFYLNNFSESDKWLRESLKTADLIAAVRPKGDALGVMGRLKIEEKKYDEAFLYLTEGVKISREKNMKISYVGNLNLLGQLEVVRKNYVKAKPILEESIKTSREMGKTNTLWESLYWLGMLYKDNKQLPQSAQYLKESIEVIEKIRNKVSGGEEARKLFSSDKNILKVYEALVDVLLQQGETDLALSYIQKNNEDNLKEKFKGLDVKFQNADKNRVLEEEREKKARLDGIEKQIENEKALPTEKQNLEKLKNLEGIKTVAEGDYLKFVNQQVNVRPELSRFFNNSVQPAQLKGKKKQIPNDMALLSYLPGENQLYIFVATSDTVLAKVVNITRAQLTRNINAVLNIVRTNQGVFEKLNIKNEAVEREEEVNEMKQADALLKPFEELYHYMISPASAEIAGKKRLCIIPNGSLSYIPFQLLGKTLKNGKFSLLMNQYAIFYANSTDMLLRVTGSETRQLKILAFGNPDKTLPSTELEVVEIKSLYPNSSIFLREEATEDKAKFAGEEFNVMHFATHGNLDYEDFGKSFITMAGNPAKDEDGKLTLEELWGMDVMSHLNIVVLSACQTAVSKGSDESSPVSPASGFLQNGVKSVVATLWKVDDEATSILMQDFYKNIKTMDAVDALRLAQVQLSNNPKFSHPYYWAAAVLLGDWR